MPFQYIGGGGTTDHGSLTGLDDDDHEQYLEIETAEDPRPQVFYQAATPTGTEGDIWVVDI
jgi:hypothetical protein